MSYPLSPYLAGWELSPIHQSIPGLVGAVSVHTWLGESGVLSTSPYLPGWELCPISTSPMSPYLPGWELCPIHHSIPGWVGAVSYPPVPTWMRESCVLSISQPIPARMGAVSYPPVHTWLGRSCIVYCSFQTCNHKELGTPHLYISAPQFCPVLEIALLRQRNSVPNHK